MIFYSYIFRIAGDISYTYSEKFGGKKAKFIFKKNEGVLNTLVYNLRLMQKEELKLIRNILER